MGKNIDKRPVLGQAKLVPWAIAALSLLAAAISLGIAVFNNGTVPVGWIAALGLLVFAGILGVIYLTIGKIVRLTAEHQQLNDSLTDMEKLKEKSDRRLEAVFEINQKFVEAGEEREIIDLVLRYSVDLAGATGALFVPFDDYNQPLAAVSYGEKPFPITDLWAEYLASPEVRNRCRNCQKGSPLDSTCPLLHGPFEEAKGLYCLPLRKGEREYGVLNLYIPGTTSPDEETQEFLKSLADQSALALEGYRLRKRELATLQQLQAVRQKTDTKGQLNGLIENIQQALDADYVILGLSSAVRTSRGATHGFGETLTIGAVDESTLPLMDGILQGVSRSGKPVIISGGEGSNLSGSKSSRNNSGSHSFIAAPVFQDDGQVYGVVLAAHQRSQVFRPRQLAVLQHFAGQIGVALQISHQMADLRYQTVIEERRRLAREIHDGLAQILGFLKLQMAQMQSYLEKGDDERLHMMIQEGYQTVSEAYQEVRYAIDGLRVPADDQKRSWLEQILEEFRENMGSEGLEVELTAQTVSTVVPPEIQAELIRILQESLSNVRKHAMATKVWVSYCQEDQDISLEIHDNGRGFASEDVISASRHGLRGMRERADLIGAEFQVISRPQNGTIIKVSVPLNEIHIAS